MARKFIFPDTIMVYQSDSSIFGLEEANEDEKRTDEERAIDLSDDNQIAKYKLVSVGTKVSPTVSWDKK